MADLLLFESFSGGDIVVSGNDVLTTETFCNQVYLALFGGNPSETHTDREEKSIGQQNIDWWGNNTFFPSEPEKHFVSLTEQTLDRVALNTTGRKEIEEAVKFDLTYMEDLGFATTDVEVVLLGNDRIGIRVQLNQPTNLDDKTFVYIWDNAKQTGLLCGKDIDYQTLLEQANNFADFNDDFNIDYLI